MFEDIAKKMSIVIKKIKGEARITESNIKSILRDIRITLLEADVALSVVQKIINEVKVKAIGQEVLESLSPGNVFVSIMQKELVSIISGNYDGKISNINISTTSPAVILIAGLQGSGKTTIVAKLAKMLNKFHKKKVITASCDIYRPAAIMQLKILSKKAGVDFYLSDKTQKVIDIGLSAVQFAKKNYYDVLIVDTAGRLTVDNSMMNEIYSLNNKLRPIETLLVLDSMLGQDAINAAKAFNDTLNITGIILTKLDGDSRGGSALSARYVTGKPIKFIGLTENLDGLEIFNPNRMINRILGMGDILSIVEKAKNNINEEINYKFSQKIKKGENFDLNDFKLQILNLKKIGGLSSMIDNLPMQFKESFTNLGMKFSENIISKMEVIIDSMTVIERLNPNLIKANRKRRIAFGSGVKVQDVNYLLNQYNQINLIIKKFKGNGINKLINGINKIFYKK